MKSFDEIEKSVRRKAEVRVAERARRRTIILRSCAIGAGAAAVLGIGLTTYALRAPKKPAPSQSGIIVETETTSAETTVTPTSLNTTAPQTATTERTTSTTALTTASSARSTTATVHTNVTAAHTTRTAVTTTAATSPITTTAAQTTGAAVQTTEAVTTAAEATTELPATDIVQLPWKRVVYGEKKIYRMCCRDNEQITAAAEDIGEYYGEAALMIDDEKSPCQLYAYKNYSPTYVCAVKETEDSEPKLYSSSVGCDTLGELLEATDFENTVVIKEAHKFYNTSYDTSFEKTPTMDDLMKALSDTSLEKSDVSMNSCSYTLVVEIPELGVDNGIIELLRSPGELSKSGFITFDVFGNRNRFNIGTKKLDEFILSFDESFSPKIEYKK